MGSQLDTALVLLAGWLLLGAVVFLVSHLILSTLSTESGPGSPARAGAKTDATAAAPTPPTRCRSNTRVSLPPGIGNTPQVNTG